MMDMPFFDWGANRKQRRAPWNQVSSWLAIFEFVNRFRIIEI